MPHPIVQTGSGTQAIDSSFDDKQSEYERVLVPLTIQDCKSGSSDPEDEEEEEELEEGEEGAEEGGESASKEDGGGEDKSAE